MSNVGQIEGLTKKRTKKHHKELLDDLATIFPQRKDGEDKVDPKVLGAWLRIQRVIHCEMNPGASLETIEINEDGNQSVHVTFKTSHHWYDEENQSKLNITVYDSEGENEAVFSKTLTKADLIKTFNFCSTALAHHDR